MNETLDEGVRYLPEDTFTGQNQEPSEPLIVMDLTPEESAVDDALNTLVNENPWLVKFLVDGTSDSSDPNGDVVVVISDDTATGDDPAPPPPANNGKKK
jgi:hypothetical protein